MAEAAALHRDPLGLASWQATGPGELDWGLQAHSGGIPGEATRRPYLPLSCLIKPSHIPGGETKPRETWRPTQDSDPRFQSGCSPHPPPTTTSLSQQLGSS